MKQYYIIVYVVLCVIMTTAKSASDNCFSSSDPISCYFEQLVLEFPSTLCAPLNEDGSQYLCLNDLVCSDIIIGSIPSAYQANLTLDVSLRELSTYCTSNWNATFSDRVTEEGTVGIAVSQTDISIDVLFGKDKNTLLPVSTNFSSCEISNIEVNSDFTGLNKIFNAVAQRAINEIIPNALNQVVCQKLANFVAVNITDILVETIDPALQNIIDSQGSIPPIFFGAISWMQSKLVAVFQLLLEVVNGKVQDTKRSLTALVYDETDGLPAIVSLIEYLTNGTGKIEVHVNESFQLPYMNVYVDSIIVRGLDTIESTTAFVPNMYSNVSLDFGVVMHRLGFEISLRTQLHNSSYIKSYRIFFEMSGVNLTMTLDFAIDKYAFEHLYVGQLGDSECILSTVDYIALSNVELVTFRDHLTTGLLLLMSF